MALGFVYATYYYFKYNTNVRKIIRIYTHTCQENLVTNVDICLELGTSWWLASRSELCEGAAR